MKRTNSVAMANCILVMAEKKDKIIQQMKLHKIIYFYQGWYLGIHGENPLTDQPDAMRFGPVYHELWKQSRAYGIDPLTEPFDAEDYIPSEKQQELLEIVFDHYVEFSAAKLSRMTHAEGSPWEKAWKLLEGPGYTISETSMKEYFHKEYNKK